MNKSIYLLLGLLLTLNLVSATYTFSVKENVFTTNSTTLYAFPHILNGTYVDTANLISNGYMNANCSDLNIETSLNTTAKYTWDNYNDVSFGCNTPQSLVWVGGDIDGANTTYMNINYGDPSANNLPDTSMWTDYADGVFHLSGNLADATGLVSSCFSTDGVDPVDENYVGGKFGSAFGHEGGIYIDCDNNYAYTNNFTISTWFYSNTDTGSYYLVSKGDTGFSMYAIIYDADNYQVKCIMGDGISTQATATSSGSTAYDLFWNHVACVKTDNDILVYLNGELKGNATASFTVDTSTYKFMIGYSDNFAGSIFDGRTDEVRVYDRVLSSDEINREYNYGMSLMEEPVIPTTTTTTTSTTSTTTTSTTTSSTTTVTVPTTTTLASPQPSGISGMLTDVGQGLGSLLTGFSLPVVIFLILLSAGSMVVVIFSKISEGIGKKV